jgi:hypothetical protein
VIAIFAVVAGVLFHPYWTDVPADEAKKKFALALRPTAAAPLPSVPTGSRLSVLSLPGTRNY